MQFLDPQMTLIKLSKNKMVIWLALTLWSNHRMTHSKLKRRLVEIWQDTMLRSSHPTMVSQAMPKHSRWKRRMEGTWQAIMQSSNLQIITIIQYHKSLMMDLSIWLDQMNLKFKVSKLKRRTWEQWQAIMLWLKNLTNRITKINHIAKVLNETKKLRLSKSKRNKMDKWPVSMPLWNLQIIKVTR